MAVAKSKDKNLGKAIVALAAKPVAYDGYTMELIGASYDKSSGDPMKDIQVVGTGLSHEAFDDATARGFALGFKNSSNSETAKKDAYLSLYVKYGLAGSGGQRDSVKPETEFSGTDDQNEAVEFIYLSNKDKYIDTSYPYGVLVFKTFYDSHSVRLDLNGTPYIINVDQLKKP